MGERTVPFITAPNWLKAAQRCGFNIEPIFQRHGVLVDLNDLENTTIEVSTLDRVMQECTRAAADEHFPFVLGETFAFEYLPDLETFVTTSGSIRDASRIFVWLRELVTPMVAVTLEEQGEWACVVLSDPDGWNSLEQPWQSEAMFASIVRFGRALLGSQGDFRSLRFRHPEPVYSQAYHRHFRMPLSFSQPRYELVVPRDLLDQPLQGAAPELHQQAESLVRQRLARQSRQGRMTARVLAAFEEDDALLRGSVTDTAQALSTGVRTLQRRLRDEQGNFARLQMQARYHKAAQLLRLPEASVETISETLGFADRRSFSRAFKRWSGRTPGEFRRNPDNSP